LFLFVLFIVVLAFLITIFLTTIEYTIILSILLLAILWITRIIWLPENHGNTAVRKLSIAAAFSTVAAFSFWSNVKTWLAQSVLQNVFPGITTDDASMNYIPPIAFAFILAVIWVVNYNMRDQSAMGRHPDQITKDIKELDFIDQLVNVCGSLADDLRSIDLKTNWSVRRFIPLDAEVELQSSSGSVKRVSDLLTSIKKSSDRLFLVLGDPGSGKSVALRKLALDLISESRETQKIPIYINLREWVVNRKWSSDNPPKVRELEEFIKRNVKNRDIVTTQFFNKYYDKLYNRGSLYFILDSFDEIPAVLDETDNSELIKSLSNVIFKFLKGARASESQGILSSRIFRKPTSEFQTKVVIEVRPFDEAKIINALKASIHFDDSFINALFKQRLDLIPISRNPFTLALIADYAENNNYTLPANQSELYSSYISNTFNNCRERLEKKNLSIEKFVKFTKVIASEMFQNFGLEVPVDQLRKKFSTIPIDDVIDVLTFSRIGRLGTGDSNQFSFVHRRFCEYFAVQAMIDKGNEVDLDVIPTDSQWRDALVLLCEVVDEQRASIVAQFCWKVIDETKNLQDLKALHSLRFLNDAFKGRLKCLHSFRADLSEYIFSEIRSNNSILSIKIAIESLGLLESAEVDRCVLAAFELRNSWLDETSIKACRHLPGITPHLKQQVIRYLDAIPIDSLIRKKKDLGFSLRLSDAFKPALIFFKVRLADALATSAALMISLIIFPLFTFAMVMYFWLIDSSSTLLTNLALQSERKTDSLFGKRLAVFRFAFGLLLSIFFIAFTLRDAPLNLDIQLNLNFQLLDDLLKEVLQPFSALMRTGWFINSKIPSTAFYCLHVFAIILVFPLYKLPYLSSFVSIPRWKTIAAAFAAIIVMGIFLTVMFYLIPKLPSLLVVTAGGIAIATMIFQLCRSHYRGMKVYKTINKAKLNKREYIFQCFKELEPYPAYRMKLAEYIASNIKAVKGTWPDDSLFKVSKSEACLMLAKMEEKWLGLNR
jgi:hypothetical protein